MMDLILEDLPLRLQLVKALTVEQTSVVPDSVLFSERPLLATEVADK